MNVENTKTCYEDPKSSLHNKNKFLQMIVNKKYHRSKQGRNSEMAKMEYPIQAFNTKLDIR